MFTQSKALLRNVSARNFSTFQPAKLPDLPYDFGDLQPIISADIMKIHHQAHHKAYVTNYNKAVEDFLDAQSKGDVSKIASLQGAIRFNGGGHINHSIFWTNLAAPKNGGGQLPDSKSSLAVQVQRDFGSFENLIAEFSRKSVGVQVSSTKLNLNFVGIRMGMVGMEQNHQKFGYSRNAKPRSLGLDWIDPSFG